jgi:hypothetical protein
MSDMPGKRPAYQPEFAYSRASVIAHFQHFLFMPFSSLSYWQGRVVASTINPF